mgnify:CR=1 FL=1
MAIERRPATPIDGTIEQEADEEIEITIEDPESLAIETDDGGMIIDFDPSAKEIGDEGFNSNLAEFIDDDKLNELGNELISSFNGDKESRSEWEETYTKGLDQLGLKIEERTEPWSGACGVFHPMLSEAVIRFQSQSITEMFPAQGPVRTKIVGKITDNKEKQAQRVEDYLNFLLTHEMSEYRTETEKMLFSLPLAGSAFRKVYFDPSLDRPSSIFVPAEDVVVNYGASDLETCERATHVMRKSSNTIRKMQVNGFYRDVELPEGSQNISDITKKYNDITGEQDTYNYDQSHTVLEMQVDLDLEGFEDTNKQGKQTGIAIPYVVTIDYPSGIILSIRRNYYEDDSKKIRSMSAVQARLHASMRKEFDILVGIVKDFTEPAYPYEMDEEEFIKASDFDERVDILPVSDPNAATMAQRIMQYQAAMQLAQSSPDMYNLPELHRQMLEVLGIEDVDAIVPDTNDIKPVDPVTAVQNLINGKPVKAFIEQDHEAHISVVASAQQDPEIMRIVEQSPKAPVILASASAYVNEHLTMKYRKEVEREMGIELPAEGEPLPADVEKRISSLVAEAAARVLGTSQQRAEQERIEQQQKDPLILMKEREVAIKEAEVQRKSTEDQGRLQLDTMKAASRDELEKERLKSQNELAGMKLGQQIASDLIENEDKERKQNIEDYKIGLDIAKNLTEDINKNE